MAPRHVANLELVSKEATTTEAGYMSAADKQRLLNSTALGHVHAITDITGLSPVLNTLVAGPSSSTNGNIALMDGATGKVIKDSGTSLVSLNTSISNAQTTAQAAKDRANHTGKQPISTIQTTGIATAFVFGRTATSGDATSLVLSSETTNNSVALRTAAGVLRGESDANAKSLVNNDSLNTILTDRLASIDLSLYQTRSQRNAANGYAGLDASGKISENQLPALAVADVFEAGSQAAMLALTAENGDICVRSDLNKSFILKQRPASTLANWVELRTPTDAVLSVIGLGGAINQTDLRNALGLASAAYSATEDLPVSSATQTELNKKFDKAGGTISGPLTLTSESGHVFTVLRGDGWKEVILDNTAGDRQAWFGFDPNNYLFGFSVISGATTKQVSLNLSGQLVLPDAPTDLMAATSKTYVDTQDNKKLTKAADTGIGGFTSTSVPDGTKSSGTYTPSPSTSNWRSITNGGAFTLAAPTLANSYSMQIDVTNSATAGAITFTGFVAGYPKGDGLTTTNGHKFKIVISKSQAGNTVTVEALQ